MTIDTKAKLEKILERMSRSGNPEDYFWYLGGQMSHIAQFNIPRFKQVEEILHNNGYNIISPNEIDDDVIRKESLASEDGDPRKRSVKYERLLARDLTIISMPACVGGIFIPGWRESYGAVLEKTVLEALGKQVLEFVDKNEFGCPGLTAIENEANLVLSSPGAVMINDTVKETDYALPR